MATHNPTQKAPERETFKIPIGPQHPALKEPGHFEFAVDGETVTDATVRLGYVHRGIEKGVESRTWIQGQYLVERVCGICSHVHATTYCLAVEKLAGVEAPPRAQAIRSLVAELERIHSHMLWLGVAAHEAGFDMLFMYSWRDRETVMNLLEGITGNRVNYSANILGGVKCDITPEQDAAIRAGVDYLEERTRHYLDVVQNDTMFMRRTKNVGTMTREQAEQMGVVGPTARASGVPRDIRVDAPYAAYKDFPVNVITETAGDLHARFVVRVNELFETFRLIRAILDHLPEGDLQTRVKRKIPAGETIMRIEAPRGELFYYVKSAGGETPDRVKIRTPTLPNMASVLELAVGHQLADMPMILTGIDPCFSCNDRMITVRDTHSNQRDVWTWDQLRKYGMNAAQ
ncbi:MAG: nickel-dependent hydrogenase large subunit [Anaerolineae bacterium]|nr:nickel-dependent hydrogenase large subunit [Anaerolineae bacterium]